LVRRAKDEQTFRQRLGAFLFGSSLEIVLVPMALVYLGERLDVILGTSKLFGWLPRWPAILLLGAGALWLAWSIVWQHMKGKGTPLPLLPTKELLCDGPYRFTRNPMGFGGILWLAGWSLLVKSPSALIGGVGFFAILVLTWDKLIEEKELSSRFGDAYDVYRRSVPFLFPRVGRGQHATTRDSLGSIPE
jgi:protein-S-isoprenylcysteine O-methyltransferase Ste14